MEQIDGISSGFRGGLVLEEESGQREARRAGLLAHIG